MHSARDEVRRRIHTALRDIPAGEQSSDIPVARLYTQCGANAPATLIERLTDRLVDYRAQVRHVMPTALPDAIAAACTTRQIRQLVVPADLPETWLSPAVVPLRDVGLTNDQIAGSDGVLTGCAIAVAQTGTIILDSGPLQGRRVLTLLPDYHMCVVRADQIVDLVPQAVTWLAAGAREHTRPLTWISGPSATSDIELNRVEGVHGPRTLEVIIVLPSEHDGENDKAKGTA